MKRLLKKTPVDLINIIKDYKNQIDYVKKFNKVIKQLKNYKNITNYENIDNDLHIISYDSEFELFYHKVIFEKPYEIFVIDVFDEEGEILPYNN